MVAPLTRQCIQQAFQPKAFGIDGWPESGLPVAMMRTDVATPCWKRV